MYGKRTLWVGCGYVALQLHGISFSTNTTTDVAYGFMSMGIGSGWSYNN